MQYDVLIVGGGPGGIYSAYELLEKRPDLKIALFEAGHALARRHCPIDGVKVKSCVKCPTCAIMNGFGGAGRLFRRQIQHHQRVRRHPARVYRQKAGPGADANMWTRSTWPTAARAPSCTPPAAPPFKKLCLQNDLHLLDASVRHLGTDINLCGAGEPV